MLKNRRVLIVIGVVAVVIVAGLGLTFAYVFSHASASTTASVTPTPAITITPKVGARVCATGVIQSIDGQNQSFVVAKARGNKSVTITVDSATTYHKKGIKAMSFSGLAVGDHVRVIAQGTCDNQAQTFAAKSVTVFMPANNATPTISPTPTT